MRHPTTSRPSLAVRMGVAAAAVLGVLVPATGAQAAGCTVKVVQHPDSEGTPFDVLNGIDARTATDIWAVGSADAFGTPLVEHFNGHGWKIVAAPDQGSTTELYDVDALSATNAWAVGYFTPASGGDYRTLVEHWNGQKWSVVASPNPVAGADNFLKGVAAISASNVWAVGSNGRPGTKTIIEHWNGSKWLSVPGAHLSNGGDLEDVSAISKTNVVAVGHEGIVGTGTPLVERFDGASWTQEELPAVQTGADLAGVSTPSATAQWAAGSQGGTAATQTYTVRNTGHGWQVVDSPNTSTTLLNEFTDVSAVSATNAWAVGDHESSGNVRRTLIAHFTNGAWSIVASPNLGSDDNRLFGIATPSGTNLWGVGIASHPIGSTGLIEHGC